MASTNPGVENVRAGVVYTIDDVQFTGTAEIPDADDVLAGVPVDDTEGTFEAPTEAEVLEGVEFGPDGTLTGSYVAASLTEAVLIGQAPPSPSPIVLEITQGDTGLFNLKAVNGPDAEAVDLTGAVFETRIKGTEGDVVLPNENHTAAANQTTHRGEFTLAFEDTDSQAMKLGVGKEIVTKITVGASIVYFHGMQVLTVIQKAPVN